MNLTNSLQRSFNIFKLCKPNNNVWVECYSNGREQGLCFCNSKLKLCVAEDRRSDSIVIYYGEDKWEHFDPFKNMITEETYKKRSRYFDTEEQAADFINSYFGD